MRYAKIRNLSEHTVIYYREQLIAFRNLLEQQRISTDPTKMTLRIIENNVILYLLDSKGRKETSINTLLRAVRAFFNFLEKDGMISESPVANLRLLKAQRTIIETFSREQIRQLFAQPDQATFTGFRDYVILSLFLETGVRLREMSEIKVGDIRWEDSQILVHGKGAKDRLVPIQHTMKRILRKYVTIRGNVRTDNLFVNIDNGPLSLRQLQSRVGKYGRMAKIENVRCSPHTLRHTFAKMAVQNGANVFTLQSILGHETLEQVRIYVNLFGNDITDAHRKFSPLENLY